MNRKSEGPLDGNLLRLKAEEALINKQPEPDKSLQDADEKRLLHELQVHRVELEMQNEELRMANEAAEAALRRYSMLYDFAPMGYLTLNADGRIIELNFTAAEMLGDKHFSFAGRNFMVFIAEDSLPVFADFFSKLFSVEGKESCEVMLSHGGQPLGKVFMEGVVIGDDRKCLLSVLNLSDLRK
jgi:PAS domain-containing protein